MQRKNLEELAQGQGLELLGVIRTGPVKSFKAFQQWITEGNHASMTYLESHINIRHDPSELFPNCKTAAIFGLNYGSLHDKDHQCPLPVAKYARFRDYHKLLRSRLGAIVGSLQLKYPKIRYQIAVDTVPVLEKALAAATARGFIGKNTLYIHPKLGSYLLLGEIFLDIEIEIDGPNSVEPNVRSESGGCGSCKRCQTHCPTGALDRSYQLDANKCLSYLTIEHRGLIPLEFWPHFRKIFYGCDICQDVCPYNRVDLPTDRVDLIQRISFPNLPEIALMNQKEYERNFGGTALTRAKIVGLKRNAIIAMTVREHPQIGQVLDLLKSDPNQVITGTIKQSREWIKVNGVTSGI